VRELTLNCNELQRFNPGVPNLEYMCRKGCICLSEGVHLRLGMEGKTYLVTLRHKNEVSLNCSKNLKVLIKF